MLNADLTYVRPINAYYQSPRWKSQKKNRPTINLLEKPHDKKTTYIGTCCLKIPVSPTLTKYTLYTHFYSCRIYNTIILCIIFFFYYSVIIFIYYHHKQWEMVVVEETR